MRDDYLYALQISKEDYYAYQIRQHTVESLIVADKLYDRRFIHWWIRDWLEEPVIPKDQLPLCVENEIRFKPKWYVAHVKYCVNHSLLDILRATWFPEAVPRDIMNAVRMLNVQMRTIRFLLNEGFPPTEKIFLHAIMDTQMDLLKICFGHGWNINQQLGEYTPLEWCAAYANRDAVDTCLLYGAHISERAIRNSLQRPENFFRLMEEDHIQLNDSHLKAAADRAFLQYQTQRTCSHDMYRIFEEMYARNVQAGSYYRNISGMRDYVTDPALKASLSLFC